VEDGRFVHDPTCTSPLAIGAGMMRCCKCGGRLTAGERPVATAPAPDERVTRSVLRFMPAGLAEGDTRQRL